MPATSEESLFVWESTVRDYELDSQGIVNNSTYVNYFEQCRNDYARFLEIDFIEFHRAGYDLVVAELEIKYKLPLVAEEKFYVTAALSEENEKRVIFYQEIRRSADKRLVAKASVSVACIDRKAKKSYIPARLKEKLP